MLYLKNNTIHKGDYVSSTPILSIHLRKGAGLKKTNGEEWFDCVEYQFLGDNLRFSMVEMNEIMNLIKNHAVKNGLSL